MFGPRSSQHKEPEEEEEVKQEQEKREKGDLHLCFKVKRPSPGRSGNIQIHT